MTSETPDRTCTTCGKPVKKGPLCNACSVRAAWLRRNPDFTPPTCKICSQEITSRQRYRAIYCSKKCKYSDPEFMAKIGTPLKRVTKVCPHCNTEFAVAVGVTHRYNYCSRTCSTDARGRDAVCKRCGAAFRHGQGAKRSYCSESCRRPPVLMSCEHCGTEFRVVPSSAARKRYCSMRCYRASDAETSIERRVREVLEHLRYTHRSQAQIGPWVVDFLVGEALVIEADGSYWHTLRPHVDRRKTADLADRGYIVWRLPEDEINADGFPAELERRLADHKVTHGEIARVPPGEAAGDLDEHRVIPRQPKRTAGREPHPGQLLLDF